MGFVGLIFSIPAIWIYNYQKNRILILLDPQRDPLGAGYHISNLKLLSAVENFLAKVS